jgi:hypothetical protein
LSRGRIAAASAARDPRMPRYHTCTDEIPLTIAAAGVGLVLIKLGTHRYFDVAMIAAWIGVLAPIPLRIWRRVTRKKRQLDAEADAGVHAQASLVTPNSGTMARLLSPTMSVAPATRRLLS